MADDETMNISFNITDERAHELIKSVARPIFERFLKGEISNGPLLSAFMDMDSLTTNEKCFLSAHCAIASMTAIQDMKKRMRIAELLQEGIL